MSAELHPSHDIPAGAYVDEEGFIIDEQGEVLGMYRKPPFQPDTPEGCDWVLSKMAEQDGHIMAIRCRRMILNQNLDQQERDRQKKSDWYLVRFGPDLERVAREQLAGKKSKTLTLDHGRISFRQSKGTNRITDMDKAVKWADWHAEQIITVKKSVTATDLAAEVTRHLEVVDREAELYPHESEADPAKEREEVAAFLESSGPRESVTITTGIVEA
ncbi:MAG: hypothetical protein M3Q75_13500 [Gemmatimonadota bacterium]|nr:hypothetical protein [Gemmatimonadota bacterium]